MVVHIMYKLDERIDVMEHWKVVDSYKNYEVSTKGRVRNVGTGQIKAQFDNGNGYLYVNLSRNGKKKNFRVSRLVATAFIPNPDNLPEVDHIDRNPYNNCVENLRWADRTTQVDNRVQEKRVRCVETGIIYESILQASVETGCDDSAISKCCRGKRKATHGLHWEYVD